MAHALPGRTTGGADTTARLVGASRVVFLVLTSAFGMAALAGTRLSMPAQAAVYLGLMGTVSLWHGGFEHVANLKRRGERFQARYLAAYLVLVVAAVGAYLVAPVVGLTVAVAVTVLKGGYGGLSVLERLADADLDHLRSPRRRAVGALVRGGAVMVVPYVTHPGVYSAVAGAMVAFFDPAAMSRVAPLFAPTVRAIVGSAYVGITLAYLAYAHQRTGGRAWLLEVGETLLLVAYFGVVPPVVAVGVYFPCWYASRQVARMTAAGESHPSLVPVAVRMLRGGFLPWVGAVAILAGLAVWLPGPDSATGWVALYSVFVAAIALPHVVVGGWLDRTQGIWSVD